MLHGRGDEREEWKAFFCSLFDFSISTRKVSVLFLFAPIWEESKEFAKQAKEIIIYMEELIKLNKIKAMRGRRSIFPSRGYLHFEVERNYNWKSSPLSFEMKINYILIIAYISKTFRPFHLLSLPFALHLHFTSLSLSYCKHLLGSYTD